MFKKDNQDTEGKIDNRDGYELTNSLVAFIMKIVFIKFLDHQTLHMQNTLFRSAGYHKGILFQLDFYIHLQILSLRAAYFTDSLIACVL